MNSKTLKRYLTILLAIIFMFGFKYLPAFTGLSQSGMQVLGIFIGVLILWLTISIDWPSILMIAALSFVPELSFKSILSGSYGNQQFIFLMYTFIMTYALSKTSYIKRTAISFITSKIAQKGPWFFISLYFASILFIGSFISPTVLFFVYLPIVEEIYHLLNLKKGDKLAAMLMMGTVIMCGISSGMTPIAHVFPLLAMGLYTDMYNIAIGYGQYMMIAIPAGLMSAALIVLLFKLVLKPDLSALKNFDVHKISGIEDKIQLSEKIVLAVFVLVVALWILPSSMTSIFETGLIHDFFAKINSFGTAMPPLIGIVILCIIQIDDKPLLNIAEAMSKGVSWPSLVMFAGTLAIGSALTNTDIGLTTWISNGLSPLIAGLSPMVMVLIFALWAAIQTNFSSNMVTSTLVTSAALVITSGINDINVAAVVVIIGMMASYSFATPPAMPCVAIASSSGWTNTMQMMKYGFAAMFISVLVACLIAYPIAIFVL